MSSFVSLDRSRRPDALARPWLLAWISASILLLPLAACGGDPNGGGEPVVRDSAGIQIIENPDQGAWSASDAWGLEEELRIGVDAGDPELQFGNVVGLDADPEGHIVVLDAQARRVRVFGPDGSLLDAFGRSGGGPGELSQGLGQPPGGLFVDAEGRIVIPDLGNQRLTRFAMDGEVLESSPVTLDQGIPLLWMRSADRAIYQQFRRMDMTGGMPQGDMTDEIVRLEPGQGRGDAVLTLPAGETFSMGSGGMPEIRMFAPEPIWTVLGDGRLVTGVSNAYSLAIQDDAGAVRAIVRRNVPRRPVTSGDQSSLLDIFASAWDEAGVPGEMIGMLLDGVQFEESWPALARLMAGPDETLWVQRVDPEGSLEGFTAEQLQAGQFGSPSWDVFDREGGYLGVIEVPEGFFPFVFVGDHLYGLHRDDLEVQRVVRMRLVRGGN